MKYSLILCKLGWHKWSYTMGGLVFYRHCSRCGKRHRRLAIVGKWADEKVGWDY